MKNTNNETETGKKPDDISNEGISTPSQKAASSKTPHYQALNAERYHRQELIRNIQNMTKNRLISYVTNSHANLERDDVLGFVDLLHNISENENVDLIVQTPGGDPDAAEKIISLIRKIVDKAQFRVIVPDMAKSAGTLIALGADRIVMSDTSELGPIDPQTIMQDGHGNYQWLPIQSYLDAYKELSDNVNKNPDDHASRLLLSRLDPAKKITYEALMSRTRKLAEKQLNQWMLANPKDGAAYTLVVERLMDTKRWPAHSQVIGYKDAKEMKLEVDYLPRESEEWQMYWQLYCLQRIAIKNHAKLFESDYASLVI